MTGELEKLIITSFKDGAQNDKDSAYTATINPDQIAIDSKIEYESTDEAGSGGERIFKGIANPKLTLKLLVDGTGIIPPAKQSKRSFSDLAANFLGEDEPEVGESLSVVNQEIEAFKDVAAKYEGDIHETKSVQIAWGELLFKGKMESMKVTYTLFKPDGSPIRAIINAVFVGTIDIVTRKKEEKNSSPDLTHIRTVMRGDTLPLMCHRIYKNPKLYLKIAKVNGLSNYRKLTVGAKLFFPPIKNQA